MNEVRNMIIRCKRDDEFSHTRVIESSCNCDFMVNEEDIYTVVSPGYFEEDIREYYTICPICGHINMLKPDKLPDDAKERIAVRCDDEPFLYRKNNLRSELIHLDRMGRAMMLKRHK